LGSGTNRRSEKRRRQWRVVGFGGRVGGFGAEADRRGHGCCVGASAAAVEDGGQGRGWCWSFSDGGMELLVCFHLFFS